MNDFDMEGLHARINQQLGNLNDVINQALGDVGDLTEPDESNERVTEQQFEVGPAPALVIRNVSGRIRIEAGQEGIIRIRATRHGSARAMANTTVEIERDGDRITVQTGPAHSHPLRLGFNLSSVDYDVTVPPHCEVRAKAVSADVIVRGTQAPVSVETVSGDVSLEQGAGSYGITTVSGDVVSRGLSGELALRTTSGDARITASRLTSFNLNTVSGDVIIESPLIAGQHYFAKTVSGDLHVLVPEGTGVTVQMKSVSGSVKSELPAEIIKAGRRSWQGRINGGGATLEMQSVSGDLRIARGMQATEGTEPAGDQSADEPREPSAAPEPSAPVAEDSEMLAILKALEAGDITLDEATSRLEALSNDVAD
jgi:hypothetical protein